MTIRLEVAVLDGRYALAQLPPGSPNTNSPYNNPTCGQFAATVVSREGISIACEECDVPAGAIAQLGYRCLEIAGTFGLSSVGIVAAVVQPLAAAGISLFAYSTWQTDYILVQDDQLPIAVKALREAGHTVR